MALLDWFQQLFGNVPELALFVSLFLGYLIGRIKFGPISLGGIAGTLIVAIVIGQLGVTINDDAKNIAFVIFIFADAAQLLCIGDLVLLIGQRAHLIDCDRVIGPESDDLDSLQFSIERRDIWLTDASIAGKTIADIYREVDPDQSRGVYLGELTRGEVSLPPLPETKVERGDIVTLTGSRKDLDRVIGLLGRVVPKSTATDFVYLGLGAALGILIGRFTIDAGSVPISLGTGGGCLLTGLLFGWYHSRHPTIGNYPPAAAQFAKDIGLSTFIAAVGLSVGPQTASLIREYGIVLPLAGILNVIIPATVSLFVGYRLLKVDALVLVGAIAGQQCSTPAGTAVVDKVGNTVPMLGYTVTYALSNVLLPLLGPLVVLLTYRLQ